MEEITNESIRKAEVDKCDFIKTILMVVIVLFHSVVFWNGSWFTKNPVYESDLLRWISQWLRSLSSSYCFTLISGYLFYYLKYERGKYECFLSFVKTKAKRLLVPYFVVTLMWVAPFQYVYSDESVIVIITNMLFGTAPKQIWFLMMLFNVSIIFWWCSEFVYKHNVLSFVAAVVLYGFGLCGSQITPDYYQIWTTLRYLMFFLMGFKMRQHGTHMLRKVPNVLWMFLNIMLFLPFMYFSQFESFQYKVLKSVVYFPLCIVGALMMFVLLQKAATRIPYQDSRLYRFLKEKTMLVYIFHQQLIYIFISLFNGVVNPYLNAAINFVGSILLSLLLSVVVKRFKVLRILLGEKD